MSSDTLRGNLCVMCGAIIPEGRMVCPTCEKQAFSHTKTSKRRHTAFWLRLLTRPKPK